MTVLLNNDQILWRWRLESLKNWLIFVMLHCFLWFGTTYATNASLLWTTSVEEMYLFSSISALFSWWIIQQCFLQIVQKIVWHFNDWRKVSALWKSLENIDTMCYIWLCCCFAWTLTITSTEQWRFPSLSKFIPTKGRCELVTCSSIDVPWKKFSRRSRAFSERIFPGVTIRKIAFPMQPWLYSPRGKCYPSPNDVGSITDVSTKPCKSRIDVSKDISCCSVNEIRSWIESIAPVLIWYTLNMQLTRWSLIQHISKAMQKTRYNLVVQ